MGTHAFSPDAHHNRSLRMQLRAVWCLRLIGDTEGPTLIAGATWLRGVQPLRLLGTPTTILTQGVVPGFYALGQRYLLLFAGDFISHPLILAASESLALQHATRHFSLFLQPCKQLIATMWLWIKCKFFRLFSKSELTD